MLVGDFVKNLFGAAFSGMYELATLRVYAMSEDRNPETGTFPMSLLSTESVRVQHDACTEDQKAQDGYSAKDIRLIMLQQGVRTPPEYGLGGHHLSWHFRCEVRGRGRGAIVLGHTREANAMTWFRVISDRYDWHITPRKIKTYVLGEVAYGNRDCIQKGLAVDAIEVITKPKGARVNKAGAVEYD